MACLGFYLLATHKVCSLILERLGSRVEPARTMMKPYPCSICLLLLAVSLFCAGWLIRALFRRHLNVVWLILLLLAVSIGAFFGIRFSAVTYDYEPGWRVVGFPMVAVALKYKPDLNEWWDYISYPPPVIIAANFIFWTAVPFFILFPLAWLYVRRFHHRCIPETTPTAP